MISENLKNIMYRRGMSQNQLGKKSGVGQATISNIIHRKHKPGMPSLERIAKALNVPVDILIFGPQVPGMRQEIKNLHSLPVKLQQLIDKPGDEYLIKIIKDIIDYGLSK